MDDNKPETPQDKLRRELLRAIETPYIPNLGQHFLNSSTNQVWEWDGRQWKTAHTTPQAATEKPRGLVEWQGSELAKPYEGQWVLLADDYDVIDSDCSPSELFKRNSEVRCPNIVFVMRSDTTHVPWRKEIP